MNVSRLSMTRIISVPDSQSLYNPLQSGTLVFRAGVGIFYNRALLRTIDDFKLGQQQLFLDTNALTDPISGKLMSAEQRRKFISAKLNFPQILIKDGEVVSQFGRLNTNFSRRLDENLRIPESYQINFGVERDLGNNYAVEANLNWTRGIHLWREFNVNAPRLPVGYSDFTSYIASRDFVKLPQCSKQSANLHASNAGELVRFVFQSTTPNPNAISRLVEFGVPISVFNLNSPTSSTALDAALAALSDLRPDPAGGSRTTHLSGKQLLSRADARTSTPIHDRWRVALTFHYELGTHSPSSSTMEL
jgi:hypothetical protein